MTIRVIPRLDVKAPNLVKGIHLEGLRVLGDPAIFAREYYHQGADELIYMDAVATLYGRNHLEDIIARASREIFVPLCVGGGIRTVDDIQRILRAGGDKVALNTAVIRNPDFIRQAADQFGSSTIVVSIEAIRQSDGTYLCFTDCGREPTGRVAHEWAQQAAALGAGEILVTSVDRDGTGKGYDMELVRGIAEAVSIPVIASGGAGSVDDVPAAVIHGKADAVAVGSLLHYHLVDTIDTGVERRPAHYGQYGNFKPGTIPDIKTTLRTLNIETRPIEDTREQAA
jgi:cyclase